MTSVVWSGISNQSENVWIFPLQSFYCCTTGHIVVRVITTVNQKVHTWIRFLITFLLSSIHRTFEHYECIFFGTKLIPSCLDSSLHCLQKSVLFILHFNISYKTYFIMFSLSEILPEPPDVLPTKLFYLFLKKHTSKKDKLKFRTKEKQIRWRINKSNNK